MEQAQNVGNNLALFGYPDATDDDGGGNHGNRREGLFEPENGEGNGESRLKVGKDGSLGRLNKLLALLISPKGNNRATDSHKENAGDGLASDGEAGLFDEDHNVEKRNADEKRGKGQFDGVKVDFL